MRSVWESDANIKGYSSLDRDVEADVCIVGGGLAGVWIAYMLAKEGKEVVLIEKDRLGRAESMYTTAFVTQVIDTNLTDLVSMFGERKARLSWQAGADAIAQIEAVIDEEGIDCGFMRLPLMTYARTEGEMKSLREEARAAQDLGFEARIVGSVPGFANTGAMEVLGQAKYHPIKFFEGLVEACDKLGVKIYEATEAREVSGKAGKHVLTKQGASVRAEDVVVATYDPLNNPKETRFKKGMYKTYVYGLELKESDLPEMMCEDMHNPYHYFRIDDDGGKKTMIVGGEDHRNELHFSERKSFQALRDYIDDTFLDLEYKVTHKWDGLILEPSDGLPLIGEYRPHEYIACAFSGNGMTYSAISARILADLIIRGESKYQELYDPKRSLGPKPLLYKFRDYAGIWLGGAVKNLFK